jgi:hypothetical protein
LKPRFERDREMIVVRLPSAEREFLSQVLDLLADVDGQEPESGDPAARRLNVPVYLDDERSNDEWWRLMGDELSSSRAADRKLYAGVLGKKESRLTDEEADAFLRVINEGRLAFAARLGLEVEEDHDRLPDAERAALDYMGWVLEDLTITLMGSL